MQAQRGHITLKVFNVLGKELATLITQNFPSEVTELSGMQMASQVDDSSSRVYYYRLQTEAPDEENDLVEMTAPLQFEVS